MGYHASMSRLSERLRPFGTNIFTRITALANQHKAVNLSQGFPDFDGPEFIKDAASEAMRVHHNQYAPMAGVPELRRAIAERYTRRTGLACNADTDVTVTCGCTEAIPATVMGMCNPGDEVILFEPFFDIHRSAIVLAGCVPVAVTLRPPAAAPGEQTDRPWTFDEAALRAAFTGRTKAIVINTPHNPTGKVFSRQELGLIAELCIKHDVVAICDDVYERLIFEDDVPHVAMATLPGMAERTVTLSSMGKAFSYTGWKIGWAVAPAELTACVRAAHQFLTFSVATPLQYGAVAGLQREEEAVGPLVAMLRANRDALAPVLRELGMTVYFPPSGYFIMTDISGMNRGDDVMFVQKLIEEVGVAAIPCSAFYAAPERGRMQVRFAFCKKPETVAAGIERLRAGLGRK